MTQKRVKMDYPRNLNMQGTKRDWHADSLQYAVPLKVLSQSKTICRRSTMICHGASVPQKGHVRTPSVHRRRTTKKTKTKNPNDAKVAHLGQIIGLYLMI